MTDEGTALTRRTVDRWRSMDRGWRAACLGVAITALHVLV